MSYILFHESLKDYQKLFFGEKERRLQKNSIRISVEILLDSLERFHWNLRNTFREIPLISLERFS